MQATNNIDLSGVANESNCLNEGYSIVKNNLTQIKNQCIANNKAAFMCTNEKCQSQNMFICRVGQCECEVGHMLCLKANMVGILRNIEIKEQLKNQLKTFIDKTINSMIEELSEFGQKMLGVVDDAIKSTSQFQVEKNFIKIINGNQQQQKKYDSTSSALLWKIINCKDFLMTPLFESIQKTVQKMEFDLKNQINNFNIKLQQILKRQQANKNQIKQNILKTLLRQEIKNRNQLSLSQKQNQLIKKLEGKSNIISKNQQWERLIKYFPKEIKDMKMLYRATNSNFIISTFFDRCGKVPNLMIICQSQNGNVVGGYSPLCHFRQNLQTDVWGADNKRQSFIFDLLSNRKFFLQDQQKAIAISKNQQLIRFGSSQIVINENAQWSSKNRLDYNLSYKSSQKNNIQGRIRIDGSKIQTYKLKQWEAWKVQF